MGIIGLGSQIIGCRMVGQVAGVQGGKLVARKENSCSLVVIKSRRKNRFGADSKSSLSLLNVRPQRDSCCAAPGSLVAG